MPHPNRVQPDGTFLATPARGTMMGNRGVLHDDQGVIGPARWRHRNWVCCVLTFKGRHRQVLQPRRWTELFFLDEAVAFAAGHRPCAECRRADYLRYCKAWEIATGTRASAPHMDNALHAARALPGARLLRTETASSLDLPAGVFVRHNGAVLLLGQAEAYPYAATGYGPVTARPSGSVIVLTPAPNRAILAAGYRPQIHPTAPGIGSAFD